MSKRVYNLRPDKEDVRDYRFNKLVMDKNLTVDLSKIPLNADLRPGYTKIKNQESLGACTAFSAISVIEYLYGGKDLDLSELFFYYMERADQGTINEDSGCSIRQSGLTAKKFGACIEALEPYDISKFTVAPSQEALNNALKYKIKAFYKLSKIEEIMYLLGVLKEPVLIGTTVYNSFEQVGDNGFIPMPDLSKESDLGGHAINLCGYFWDKSKITSNPKSDSAKLPWYMRLFAFINKLFGNTPTNEQKEDEYSKYDGLFFIIRNSWGKEFSDKGYMYMPARYLFEHTYDWQYFDIA